MTHLISVTCFLVCSWMLGNKVKIKVKEKERGGRKELLRNVSYLSLFFGVNFMLFHFLIDRGLSVEQTTGINNNE